MKFVGRSEQMAQLMTLWNKRMSSLVTCQGRRRIGKSRLIDEFAAKSECRYIKLTGLAPRPKMTNADQIRYFCQRLSRYGAAKDPTRVVDYGRASYIAEAAVFNKGRLSAPAVPANTAPEREHLPLTGRVRV